ncbi:hypothetical protein GHK92_07885 [Nocardioides sp. dk4132]|uniref:hypothetical protein n=1 Tax=unclassified Nocardioides TaxID=2615069 RepID=UPI001296C749|nr:MULTISPECIES: hypothetical protein [unclassified Nocardioides]MQW75790.1 hypothetical protein [Nocardioides sp. dk4132]QGA08669.1 hypothetical protein GFH29_15645 [Nocardioides sp. dk884]
MWWTMVHARNTRLQTSLAAAAVAALVGSFVSLVPQAGAVDAAPLAIAGSLPDSGVDRVAVYVDREVMGGSKAAAPIYWLPDSSITVDGDTYSVRIAPETLPDNTLTEDGLATLQVVTFDQAGNAQGAGTGSVRAVLASDGTMQWVDPLAPTVAVTSKALRSAKVQPFSIGEDIAMLSTQAAEDQEPVALDVAEVGDGSTLVDDETDGTGDDGLGDPVSVPERAVAGTPDQVVCYGAYTGRTRKRTATIGTAYPIGGNGSRMAHRVKSTDSLVASFGVAAATAGSGWDFGTSGAATTSRSSGFDWTMKTYARSYRVGVEYTKVFSYFTQKPCDEPDVVYWRPTGYTGKAGENTSGVTRPDWGKCVRFTSDGNWHRELAGANSYTYSAGVKFKGIIGIDLSSTRAYNEEARLTYSITAGRWLCGSNDIPDRAGKVMERLRNA